MTKTLPTFRLNDPDFYVADPFDAYRRLRDEYPVYWCESGGFWAVTRHEDALAVSKNPTVFCNGHGITMRGGELESVVEGGQTLLGLDPPEHTRERNLINRAFTKRAVGSLELRIREIARNILDEAPVGEPIDFVNSLAAPFPAVVIAEMLGIPAEDHKDFARWANASIGVVDPEYADLQATAMLEQHRYFEKMLALRRAEPADDLVSVIIEAETTDPAFDHVKALRLCFLLLAAGNETTRNLITHSVYELSLHPDQQAALRAGADMGCAVEEFLRWASVAIHMARTVTIDTELHGQELRAGDQVVMLYGAANRDERVFGSTVDELRLERDPNPHLSLGFGQHFCLGAALARLETKIFLEEMLDRYDRWSIAGPVERLRSTMVRGIKHMPIVLNA
jgi:cytochrome P450